MRLPSWMLWSSMGHFCGHRLYDFRPLVTHSYQLALRVRARWPDHNGARAASVVQFTYPSNDELVPKEWASSSNDGRRIRQILRNFYRLLTADAFCRLLRWQWWLCHCRVSDTLQVSVVQHDALYGRFRFYNHTSCLFPLPWKTRCANFVYPSAGCSSTRTYRLAVIVSLSGFDTFGSILNSRQSKAANAGPAEDLCR